MVAQSKKLTAAEKVPVAELVIRPGDSRPIVVRVFHDSESGFAIEVNNCPFEDVLIARYIINLLSDGIQHELVDREHHVLSAEYGVSSSFSLDDDDVPF